MTAQPYQPATHRGASPSADPDIIVVAEEAVTEEAVAGEAVAGEAVEGDLIEPEAGTDDGAATDAAATNSAATNSAATNSAATNSAATNSAATNSAEDDLTDSSPEQVSNDCPAATELSLDAAEAGAPGGTDGDSTSPAPMTAAATTAAPTTAEPATAGPVAADGQAADLGQQWHDIQAMFVDDPRGSVELAVTAADAAISAVAETLHQRQAALTQAGADTEQLREALRNYRLFCQSLADLGRQ